MSRELTLKDDLLCLSFAEDLPLFCLVVCIVCLCFTQHEHGSATRTSSGNCQETETCMVRACHDSLSKTMLQGTLGGGQRRGRQRKRWMDNIKEWTSLPMLELLTMPPTPTPHPPSKDWKKISAESSLMSPDDPIGQGTELN